MSIPPPSPPTVPALLLSNGLEASDGAKLAFMFAILASLVP
jgi:hypothetical protein